jgi:hypothetical protein
LPVVKLLGTLRYAGNAKLNVAQEKTRVDSALLEWSPACRIDRGVVQIWESSPACLMSNLLSPNLEHK